MIWIISVVLYAVIFFVTYKACNWAWNKIKQKRALKKRPRLEQIGQEPIIIERTNQQPMQMEKKEVEKNVIVNNYSFGG